MDTTFHHIENNDINVAKKDLKVIVIFPAKNEEGTIENTVSIASRSSFNPVIIVVDAYSNDKTAELATRAGATVIQQPEQIFPGKGIVMKAGIREAIARSADIILFLDADIKNLSPQWINNLVRTLLVDNCDMARGFYERHARDAGRYFRCGSSLLTSTLSSYAATLILSLLNPGISITILTSLSVVVISAKE